LYTFLDWDDEPVRVPAQPLSDDTRAAAQRMSERNFFMLDFSFFVRRANKNARP
jgi:hypothetical protein